MRGAARPEGEGRVGAYPGTFNPPTVAHLAIAATARDRCGLVRVDLVVSVRSLGKEGLTRPRLADRLAVLEEVVAARPWLGLRVTDAQLIADAAAGYDVVVVGADKWAQVVDPAWYGGSEAARDAALARLPEVAIAPRPPHPLPTDRVVLEVHRSFHAVSSTAVRGGATAWMAEEAARFAERTGAWLDDARYERWLTEEVNAAERPAPRNAP